jgi:hypothetical protein
LSLEYQRRLQAAELNHADFSRCVRMERFAQAKTWERQREGKGLDEFDNFWKSFSGSSDQFEAVTFKPNMSIVESGRLISPMAHAMTESWAKGLEAAQQAKRLATSMEDRGKWSNWLDPNFSGRSTVAMIFSSFDAIIQRTVQVVVLNRCLQCALALHAYEAEEGRLPETLEALVPKYLPAVPEDPLTGKALKWNPRTERIYSVGEDGRDDGGDFENSDRIMRGDKDWGIVYPRPAITE